MTDRGTQISISPLINSCQVSSDTYIPGVFTPINYGINVRILELTLTSTEVPTTGQLWPRGNI